MPNMAERNARVVDDILVKPISRQRLEELIGRL